MTDQNISRIDSHDEKCNECDIKVDRGCQGRASHTGRGSVAANKSHRPDVEFAAGFGQSTRIWTVDEWNSLFALGFEMKVA